MHRHLFDLVDIDPKNIHLPNSEWSKEEVKEKCSAYEHTIDNLGGIDLQILGIGKNGHIGFNEPGSSFHSKTRVIHLRMYSFNLTDETTYLLNRMLDYEGLGNKLFTIR